MNVGLVGLSGSGRSSVFGALAVGAKIASHHAGPLGEIHQAAVDVPDARLQVLSDLHKSKKITHTRINLVDLPGLGCGQLPKGQNPQIIAAARQQDMLLAVIRDFENPGNPHPLGSVDAARDLRLLLEEFQLADLTVIENRLEKLEETLKKPTPERDQQLQEKAAIEKCKAALEETGSAATAELTPEEQLRVSGFRFLTRKPLAVIRNVGEDQVGTEADRLDEGFPQETLCASIEAELAQLDDEERGEFMADYGIEEFSQQRIIRTLYDASNLITFFTAGETESRAWPLKQGLTALEAAGKIHTDIARGFIRAEVYRYEDLVELGSEKAVKDAGKFRLEGKEYVILEGDVVFFRFSV